ncbi:MAG TPA: hypothetical protein VLA56_13605 [Pseudomonadales bacterium]|nr:hypothetical protein [Pseudomonadales bacterium]
MNRRQSLIAVVLLCCTTVRPELHAASLYRYEGGPLLVSLESGRKLAIVVEGEATRTRDRVRILIDGEAWKSTRLTLSRLERRMSGKIDGQDLMARCEAVFTGMQHMAGVWTVTKCSFTLDGTRVGEIQTGVKETTGD